MVKNETPADGRSDDSNSPRGSSYSATGRKVNTGFAVALASLLLVGYTSYVSDQGLAQSVRWVDHTHEVLSSLDKLLSVVTDAETAERGYVISGDESYLAQYSQSLRTSAGIYKHLVALTVDNTIQQQRLRTLRTLVDQRLAQFNVVLDLRRIEGFAAAQREILKGLGRQMHEQIRGVIDEMTRTEQRLLDQRQRQAHHRNLINQSVTWGGGTLAFGFVGLAAVAIRRDLVGRDRAERELHQARDELELRVRQRTAELARSNDTLTASERRFRAFVSATSDVMYRVSGDWSQMRPLNGQDFTPDTVEPTPSWLEKHVHPDDRVRLAQARHAAMQTKSTFELEHRVSREDGSLGWIFSRAVPFLSEGGDIEEWFGAASDVTPRKLAETKLQEQLARLALLSRITRAIGERQDIRSIFQVVIRTLEEHLPVDFCAICLHDPRSSELTVTCVGRYSEPLAIELAMTEQAPIPIDENGLSRCVHGQLVYEPDLKEVHFPFPQRLLRGGLNAFVAAPLLVESQVFGVLLAARRQSDSFSSGECEFLRQLSEHIALAAHQAQLHGALQRAYDDLRQTQQAVMQQERLLALGKMASGIAHDINNAISPVSLYTESLLEHERDLSPRTRQYLEIIQRAIDDVAHTVSRMREFYRQREPQTAQRRMDLNQLVPQVIDLTRARWSDMAQQRGIVIQVQSDLAPHLPPIMGVESELRDALTNLIFNAVDAMPEGGRLMLRTQVSKKADQALERGTAQLVQIEVIDGGMGMDEDTRLRCCEPFFTTKGERGTGLGLAMVYGTAQRHNADIEVDSTVGRGTTVRLSFPVAAADGEVRGLHPMSVVPPMRILLVDDDPIVLKSLGDTLRLDGHIISSADGGQAGIDAFRAALAAAKPFQVVVTDLGMPYVDGRQVSAAVKSEATETLVLLLTGWGQRLVSNGDIPPHVDAVLSKPPKLRELREALALNFLSRTG